MDTVIAPPSPLKVSDRCDRCGAQAFVRVTLPSGATLLFCAHHGRANETALRASGAEIMDYTADIPA